jgi:hypothetical protein
MYLTSHILCAVLFVFFHHAPWVGYKGIDEVVETTDHENLRRYLVA